MGAGGFGSEWVWRWSARIALARGVVAESRIKLLKIEWGRVNFALRFNGELSGLKKLMSEADQLLAIDKK